MIHKRWIILVSALVLMGAATSFVLLTDKKSSDQTNQKQTSVELDGTSENTQTDPSDDEATQGAIKTMVRINEPDGIAAYKAVVRQNSIVRSAADDGSPIVRYLVDIPELQRTFVVEKQGDAASDFSSLYVTCPAETDLQYSAKPCKEME